MINRLFYFFSFLFVFTVCAAKSKEKSLSLWYDSPAGNWNEALPIGNGHSGAMVFGGVDFERLQLNENTLYSGEPSVIFKDVKVTPEMFDKVTDLMKEEKYKEATNLVCKNWLGRLHQYYQPFADLQIKNNKSGKVSNYKRELDISEAIVSTQYVQNGIKYKREIFASNPENVIVVHLKSNKPEGIDISINFTSEHPTAVQKSKNDRLIVHGKAPGYVERRTFEQIEAWGDQYKHPELYDEKGNRKFDKRVLYGDEIDNKGMLFEAQIKPVLPSGGVCEITDSGIHVSGTDEVYFVMSLATSYNGYDKSPSKEGIDPAQKAGDILDKAVAYDYLNLKKRHLDDYHNLFDRVKFELVSDKKQLDLPTDERIIRFAEKADPALSALLFQYGRYLMISGSRQNGQPLNLQGLWNKDIVPPWNCGYTMNINLEMNYWMAEVANLSECQEPLFTLIKELSETGTETARNMYGRRGWVAHHNTSLWRESLPNDNVPSASFWPMVQGWLCSHLWEHYLYSGDKEFLKKTAYPLTKGAAEFFADWLIDDGKGHLVTPVGVSPENQFIAPDGQATTLSMGPTMDMAIIRETFENTVFMAELLDLDSDFRKELKEKLPRLLPYQIGSRGQLQEWIYDFKEPDPTHRHLSHLYGFYPGNQITPDKTPDLFNAVKQTLTIRGDAATGWSMGWKINCWARLLDGNHAYKIIRNLFNPVQFGPKNRNGGGLYSNLLDACPPFQIDGNFGYTAGVAEILMQSHAGFIQLLPALPDVWSKGAVSGLKARGNFEVSMQWKQGQLTQATVLSSKGKECRLRTAVPVTIKQGRNVIASSSSITLNGKKYYETVFATTTGASYLIIPVQ